MALDKSSGGNIIKFKVMKGRSRLFSCSERPRAVKGVQGMTDIHPRALLLKGGFLRTRGKPARRLQRNKRAEFCLLQLNGSGTAALPPSGGGVFLWNKSRRKIKWI